MTWYLSIKNLGEIADLKLDDNKRQMVGFNIIAEKAKSGTFVEEILALLVSGGIGSFGSTIFIGSKAIVPISGDGPFVNINPTGGLFPINTQNVIGVTYQRPAAQIVVRAGGDPSTQFTRAYAKAFDVYNILTAVRNRDVSP